MREVHLSTSAVAQIAVYNGVGTNRYDILMKMVSLGIKNKFPLSWACGESRQDSHGFLDFDIQKDGIYQHTFGNKVTCPKCIQIIKKYGEK